MCHIHTETTSVWYKINSMEMSLEAATVHCSGVQGNRTPGQPSHLTGFLHTLGSVFEFSHQILKKKKRQHIFFPIRKKLSRMKATWKNISTWQNRLKRFKQPNYFLFFFTFQGESSVFGYIFSALDCYGIKSFWIFFYLNPHYLISIQCVTQAKSHGFLFYFIKAQCEKASSLSRI